MAAARVELDLDGLAAIFAAEVEPAGEGDQVATLLWLPRTPTPLTVRVERQCCAPDLSEARNTFHSVN